MPPGILAPMPDTRPLLAAALLLSSACLDAEPPPEVGRSTHEANVPVKWDPVSVFNVQVTGASNNSLKKNVATSGWDAGAVSIGTIGGHGWVRFSTSEVTTAKMLGLSRVNPGDSDRTRADINYGILLNDSGGVGIWEDGTLVANPPDGYLAGDLFYVEVTPTKIIYRKNAPPNEVILHETPIDPAEDADVFPLQVDTSIRDQNATIINVVINEDPKIHVAVQGAFFEDELRCGTPDAISIHGFALLQYDLTDLDYDTAAEFRNTDPEADVENSLLQYAMTHGIADPANEDRIIILDIEKESHPSDLWDHPSEFDDIVEGLKRRIIGARMAFPNAKLGLYGTLVPDRHGDETDDVYEARLVALQDAEAAGLFDDLTWNSTTYDGLDYLVPILFPRFGCGIPEGEEEADCEGSETTGYAAIGAYTELGIEGSRMIADLPILPLLTVRIHNGNSDYHDDLVRDLVVPNPDPDDPFAGDLTVQMQAFRDADPAVEDVVLWVDGNPHQDLFEPNVGPTDPPDCEAADQQDPDKIPTGTCWTVDDYTCWM